MRRLVPPLYDLMLMLDPNAPEARQAEIVSSTRSSIEQSGELVGAHDWGVRRLAYEIDHRPETSYQLFQFRGPPELLQRLDHSLKIADGVLRFRIIKVKPGTPPPPTPRAEPARPRAEEEGDVAVAPRAAADAPAQDEAAPEPPPAEAPVDAPAETPVTAPAEASESSEPAG